MATLSSTSPRTTRRSVVRCKTCGMIHQHGEWISPNPEFSAAMEEQTVMVIDSLCPRCEALEQTERAQTVLHFPGESEQTALPLRPPTEP